MARVPIAMATVRKSRTHITDLHCFIRIDLTSKSIVMKLMKYFSWEGCRSLAHIVTFATKKEGVKRGVCHHFFILLDLLVGLQAAMAYQIAARVCPCVCVSG